MTNSKDTCECDLTDDHGEAAELQRRLAVLTGGDLISRAAVLGVIQAMVEASKRRRPAGTPAQLALDMAAAIMGDIQGQICAIPSQSAPVGGKPCIFVLPDGRGVCFGGRWHGWLMGRHADGPWVSIARLASVDPMAAAPVGREGGE